MRTRVELPKVMVDTLAQVLRGAVPPGSFIMATEIVPKIRKIIDPDRLMNGRGIKSKFPTAYIDQGV
jgi:hypothetical protein